MTLPLLDWPLEGTHRIEARASAENPRGNAALRKIGARKEGRLRSAFVSQGRYIDQYLWAIVDDAGNHPKGNVAVHAPTCAAGALHA